MASGGSASAKRSRWLGVQAAGPTLTRSRPCGYLHRVSEVADRYARVAEGFRSRLAAVPAGRWHSPSPCEGWAARDVVVHSSSVHRNVAAMLSPPAGQTPPADADPASAWRSASAAVAEALADPERAATEVKSRVGVMTFEQMVGTLLCADTLVHTWDLARATGLDERLDPEAVVVAHRFLLPRGDQMRVPGGFGPAVVPPPGSDEQTRFLCFTGRRV